jgi:hypothetical protein
MKSLKIPVAFAAAIVLSVGASLAYLHFGDTWRASTEQTTPLYQSELDAAYNDSLSIHTRPAIASIPSNSHVAVLWDTYGKDYWACYVRTSAGQRGWVLCTQLKKQLS